MVKSILKPAYGAKYETFEEVSDAYARGVDFELTNPTIAQRGKYCSCRNFFGERVVILFGDKRQFSTDVMVHQQERK